MLLRRFGVCLRPEPIPKDQRRCCFCNQQGDGQTDGPARLLNLDLDLWVSVPASSSTDSENCVLCQRLSSLSMSE